MALLVRPGVQETAVALAQTADALERFEKEITEKGRLLQLKEEEATTRDREAQLAAAAASQLTEEQLNLIASTWRREQERMERRNRRDNLFTGGMFMLAELVLGWWLGQVLTVKGIKEYVCKIKDRFRPLGEGRGEG